MDSYDVVVIGAGNGGLTAASALAQKGVKTLLLERHNIPGGCATSFCRGRFEFEVALHQLSGMGTEQKPGPLRMALGGLGIMDDLEFVEMKELYSVVMPDGFRIALQANREEFEAELQRRFPHEKDAIKKFVDLCYQYGNEMLSAFVFRDPEPSREKFPVLYRYALRNAKEVLDEFFTDNLLKTVLSVYWGYLGMPPPRLAFAYLAMLFFTYLEFKPFHIKGGSQALSNALLNKFLSAGGTALFNCPVEKIITENGQVKGVAVAGGQTIDCSYIISNASPVATYNQLMDEGQAPEEAHSDMKGRSLGPSAFSMFIGFDCEPGQLGITEASNFIITNPDITDGPYKLMRRLQIDGELLMLSCFDAADPDFSPPGTCQANVVTLKFGETWLRVPPAEYYKTKYECAKSMLNMVESVFPNVKAHIEEIEAATPLTHMRYLGHPNGSIYGFEQHTKDSLFFQPGRYSPVKGLYFASGWIGDPGFQPTLEAGAAAARTVIRQLGA